MEKSTRKAKEALVTRNLFLIMARWPAERAVNVSGAQLTVTYRVLCHNPSLAANQSGAREVMECTQRLVKTPVPQST